MVNALTTNNVVKIQGESEGNQHYPFWFIKDSKVGIENSGVPIKTIFCDINFRLLLFQFPFSV